MAGKRASNKRSGAGKGQCSYCGGRHRGGPKGDSCGGHSVKILQTKPQKHEQTSEFAEERQRGVNMNRDAVLRRERAQERARERAKRSDKDQLKVLKERGITEGREVERLTARIAATKARKEAQEKKEKADAAA